MSIISNASFARNTDGKDLPLPLKIAIGKYLGLKSVPSKQTALPVLRKMVAGKSLTEAERQIKTKLNLIDKSKQRAMAYINPIKSGRTPEQQKRYERGIKARNMADRQVSDERSGYNKQVLGSSSFAGDSNQPHGLASGRPSGAVGVGGGTGPGNSPISRI